MAAVRAAEFRRADCVLARAEAFLAVAFEGAAFRAGVDGATFRPALAPDVDAVLVLVAPLARAVLLVFGDRLVFVDQLVFAGLFFAVNDRR